jgi:hypothetical protein
MDSQPAAISIGGTVSGAGLLVLLPVPAGLINRNSGNISTDRKTDLIQRTMTDDGGKTAEEFPGSLLPVLRQAPEMLVEQPDGGCSGGLALVHPVI